MLPVIQAHQWVRKPHELRPETLSAAQKVVTDVASGGDAAVAAYTRQFDQVNPESIRVPSDSLENALEAIDQRLLDVIGRAADNIRRFHTRQMAATWYADDGDGVRLGQRILPVEFAGLYAPGGEAAYPSSVLMTAIPAQVAGVKEIHLASPPQGNGLPHSVIMATAQFLGIRHVYAMGGAQAIAALAHGTETVQKVDVIAGPGNTYVTAAKKIVFGQVGIDSLAGPSEVVVLADDTAQAHWIAHDLMAQAEHDVLASAILVTSCLAVAEQVCAALEAKVPRMPRNYILRESLEKQGACIITDSLSESIRVVNRIAPEHLEILTRNPWDVLDKIHHAGAVFIGEMSPEPVGDYFAGPNHVLPTSGTARFASALSVEDFMRKQSVIAYTKARLQQTAGDIAAFARSESLEAHAQSVEVRLECP